MVAGSTNIPPLNAAKGADNLTWSEIIVIPRGGRPLVTANLMPASVSLWIAALARSVMRFRLSTSVPSTSARTIEIFFDGIEEERRRAKRSFQGGSGGGFTTGERERQKAKGKRQKAKGRMKNEE